MSNPLVSILMPTYNDAEYITSAIDSVFAQTHRDWELLIINDGSSDDTGEKIIPYLNDPALLKPSSRGSAPSEGKDL